MFSSCKNCTSLSIYFALHNKQSGEKTKLSPVSFIGTNPWFCIILRRIYTQKYVFDQWNDKCTAFKLIIFQDAFELLQITSTHTQTKNSSRTLSSNFYLFCAKHPLLPTSCNENKNIMWEFNFGVWVFGDYSFLTKTFTNENARPGSPDPGVWNATLLKTSSTAAYGCLKRKMSFICTFHRWLYHLSQKSQPHQKMGLSK